MIEPTYFFAVVITMSVVMVLLKGFGTLFNADQHIPEAVRRYLKYIPVAALSAIIVPATLIQQHQMIYWSTESISMVVAIGSAILLKNPAKSLILTSVIYLLLKSVIAA